MPCMLYRDLMYVMCISDFICSSDSFKFCITGPPVNVQVPFFVSMEGLVVKNGPFIEGNLTFLHVLSRHDCSVSRFGFVRAVFQFFSYVNDVRVEV